MNVLQSIFVRFFITLHPISKTSSVYNMLCCPTSRIRQASLSVFLVVFLAFFCQCSSRPDADGYGQEYPLDTESYDVIDSCMAYMDSDPVQAHHMLDSAQAVGIISPQRCDYLHAMVTFWGDNKPDSALMICNRLLDEGRFGDDHFLEAEICALATNITSSLSRHIEVLQYANRGIALCHGHERMHSDETTMMGRAGVAYVVLGRFDEASETYDRALALILEDTSFGGLNARISLQKKQAILYHEMGEYDRVIAVCHEILELVNRFDRDPSFVEPRPKTMTEPGEVTHGFAEFYQSQMYIRIANAYRMMVEHGISTDPKAHKDSASAYVEKWTLISDAHQFQNNIAEALPELYFTGYKAVFESARQLAGESFGSDTLVAEYVDYLTLLARESASRHAMDQSNGYLQRAVSVSDSIRRRELVRSFAEQAAAHMVQEAQQAQKDAEYELARNRMYIALLVTILLALVLINVLVLRNRHNKKIIETVQQNLQESQQEIMDLEQQLEEVKAERQQNNTKELFQRIEQVMVEKQLYLNPDFDLKMLAKEVGSGLTNLSLCINGITGKSFRIWLSEYRLALFVRMLEDNPDGSIDELMYSCGYKEQSTFRRHFKATYGVTVSEYRKKIAKEKNNN